MINRLIFFLVWGSFSVLGAQTHSGSSFDWLGPGNFPYETRFKYVGCVADTLVFHFVAYKRSAGGTAIVEEKEVTEIVGPAAPYMPVRPESEGAFYRAIWIKGGDTVAFNLHHFTAPAGELDTILIKIPSKEVSCDDILKMQYRTGPGGAYPWLDGSATFYGNGNNGYGTPAPFAKTPDTYIFPQELCNRMMHPCDSGPPWPETWPR